MIRIVARVVFIALVIWSTLFSSSGACANGECGSTCLDICQSEGGDLRSACDCPWGCGCLCVPGAGATTCEDYGCSTSPY